MTTRTTYSLLELNQYIRRVLSLNFEEPLWIECEIGQASQSRGHWYLDLIQKEEETIVAQCQAALWANVYFYLKKKSPVAPEELLKQGVAVKLKVNVDFHERYGLKLIIEDIDSSYTIGRLEMQRQAILQEISKRGLVRKNAECYLPPVIQKLAVISSGRAAGYQDFIKHLEDNVYGYDIRVDLYESAMQGSQVEPEMTNALERISTSGIPYDAVAIIRGGGGRTDLAAFDNLNLAISIAHFPLPVLIGIGHEIDQSVLDLVCYTSLKTPTAVADYILERDAAFEGALEELNMILRHEVMDRLQNEKDRILSLSHALRQGVYTRMGMEDQRMQHLHQWIRQSCRHTIRTHEQKLDFTETYIKAIDPDQVLSRGYTITSRDGRTIQHASELEHGVSIQTTFIDGTVKSIVE